MTLVLATAAQKVLINNPQNADIHIVDKKGYHTGVVRIDADTVVSLSWKEIPLQMRL